ncbi:MAG: hypothetical protein D3904_05115 [Candidatus Electrothrix sp. EH2]|nr:hypothetical protein [Candidatus Electrothrix sp. EH2]
MIKSYYQNLVVLGYDFRTKKDFFRQHVARKYGKEKAGETGGKRCWVEAEGGDEAKKMPIHRNIQE